ncbi:unnamed protein product [Acanthoscelides obtectus]|uniref:Uncharacterized protein n=1 Tax=Acanthoscelides obtectus TaxID=200917 RepID=A0A9P0M3S6_ACAOB|nr:unnamed protein product [Acanthoscelides obtectus]CAK1674225.1 Leucine-rich repeat-containing protein 15 [Acanthoscelides obtectus]
MPRVTNAILLILFLPQLNTKCTNHLTQKHVDDNFLDRMAYETSQLETIGITTVCTNASLPLEDFDERFCENCTREMKIFASNIPILRRTVFSGINDLNILHIQGTNTSDIEPGTFAHMSKLQEVHFTNNSITKISKNVFNPLREMKILDLSQNNLAEIDPEFLDGFLRAPCGFLTSLYRLEKSWVRTCITKELNGSSQ